jgi:hypothetical protein
MAQIQLLSDLKVSNSSAVIFGEGSTFPVTPTVNQLFMKDDGILYLYSEVGGILSWRPLTNAKEHYVHVQGIANTTWTVVHDKNTEFFTFNVFDTTGVILNVSPANVTANSFDLEFTEAVAGKCIVSVGIEQITPQVISDMFSKTGEEITAKGHLLPDTDDARNLGSASKRWHDLYVGDNSIFIGENGTINSAGITITEDASASDSNEQPTLSLSKVVVNPFSYDDGAAQTVQPSIVGGAGATNLSIGDDTHHVTIDALGKQFTVNSANFDVDAAGNMTVSGSISTAGGNVYAEIDDASTALDSVWSSTKVAAETALLIPAAQKGAIGGVAGLDGAGKVPTSQLPSLSVSSVSVVANETEQLALTVSEGDVCKRVDNSTTYMALNSTNATMADWTALTASGDVLSVAGRDGEVVLTAADVGLTNVTDDAQLTIANNLSDLTDVGVARINLGLAANTTANTSGAYRIGTFDNFNNSSATNVQNVLSDLDTAISSKAGTTHAHNTFTGDTGSGGAAGTVPAPTIGDSANFLSGGGDFQPALVPSNDLSDLDNAATARTNLGLGGAAALETGSVAGTVATGDHSHGLATTVISGYLSSSDKSKLDGIDAGATAYVHPDGNATKHIPADGSAGNIVKWSAAGTGSWGTIAHTEVSGLGNSSSKDVGTTAGTIAAGDHTHAMGDVNNVNITNIVDGQILTWDSGSGAFINEAPLSIDNIMTKSGSDITFYGNLLPSTDDTWSIGSASKKVKHMYLGTNSLSIGDNVTISDNKMKFGNGVTDYSLKFDPNDNTFGFEDHNGDAAGLKLGWLNNRHIATDNDKLDGIAENANNFAHPTGNGSNHVPHGGEEGEILIFNDQGEATWNLPPDTPLVTLPNVAGQVSGLKGYGGSTTYTYNASLANILSKDATTVTYHWSTSAGTLNTTTGPEAELTIGGTEIGTTVTLTCIGIDDLLNESNPTELELVVDPVAAPSTVNMSLPAEFTVDTAESLGVTVGDTGGDSSISYSWETSVNAGSTWITTGFSNAIQQYPTLVFTSEYENLIMVRCTATNTGGSTTVTSGLLTSISSSAPDADSQFIDTTSRTISNDSYVVDTGFERVDPSNLRLLSGNPLTVGTNIDLSGTSDVVSAVDGSSIPQVITLTSETISSAAANAITSAMTSNAGPGGTADSSATYGNNAALGAYNAFDGITGLEDIITSVGCALASQPVSGFISYEFGDGAHTIASYTIYPTTHPGGYNTNTAPRDFTLEGWNGSGWDVLDTRSGIVGWVDYTPKTFTISNPAAYTKYQLQITQTEQGNFHGGWWCTVGEIELNEAGYTGSAGIVTTVENTDGGSYTVPQIAQDGGQEPFDEMTLEAQWTRNKFTVTANGSDIEINHGITNIQPFKTNDTILASGDTDVVTTATSVVYSSVAGSGTTAYPVDTFASGSVAGWNDVITIDTDKVLSVYRDASTSNYIMCAIGTVSGTSITWGSPTTVLTTGVTDCRTVQLSNGSIFTSYSATGMWGMAGTFNGTVMSWGTPVQCDTASSYWHTGCDVVDTNKVAISWNRNSSGWKVGTAIATITGNTTVIGSVYNLPDIASPSDSQIFAADTNKLVSFTHGWHPSDGTQPNCYLYMGTLSGDVITWETTPTMAFNYGSTVNDVAVIDTDKALMVYRNKDNNNQELRMLTFSGTTPTVGPPVVITGIVFVANLVLVSTNTVAYSCSYLNANMQTTMIDCSGNLPVVGTPTVVDPTSHYSGISTTPVGSNIVIVGSRGAATTGMKSSVVAPQVDYITTITPNDSIPSNIATVELIPISLQADLNSGTAVLQDLTETYSIVNTTTAKAVATLVGDEGAFADINLKVNNSDLTDVTVTRIQADFMA